MANLCTLPTETLDVITSHLVFPHPHHAYFTCLAPFYALRLTNRALYYKTLHPFCKLAFTTLFVDFTLWSLDRLYAVSRHEVFAGYVRGVYFGHDRAVRVGLEAGSFGDCCEGGGGNGGDVRAEESENYDALLRKLGEGLQRTLPGFTNLDRIIVITPLVVEYFYHRQPPSTTPFAPITSTTPNSPKSTSLFPSSKLILRFFPFYRLLLSALSLPSAPRLTTLDTTAGRKCRDRYRSTKEDFGACSIFPSQLLRDPTPHALRGLREFRMLLSGDDEGGEMALAKLVSGMSELRVLEVRSVGLWERRPKIGGALLDIRLPRLAVLEFAHLSLDEARFVAFLEGHRGTLRELELKNVGTLNGVAEWAYHMRHDLLYGDRHWKFAPSSRDTVVEA
ncbi:hypothetical protein DM02DRAFT_611813 [Periconia macrospinosa]|uniref:Uncharacterized protein n=1 Tax=Periconia macrospinosa TaxID=97972 RepID=A0A2V1E490_9PLEO|nr:hypothetical protein DM02DRAFT_611813 [Periconia macrospinosa]